MLIIMVQFYQAAGALTWPGSHGSAKTSAIWNDVVFPAGVPVEIDDPYMIGKARTNPFFRLEEEPRVAPEVQSAFGPAKPEMWTNDRDRPSASAAGRRR